MAKRILTGVRAGLTGLRTPLGKLAVCVMTVMATGCNIFHFPGGMAYDSATGETWFAYEAEDARSNATAEKPSRRYMTPAAEASGRRYVRLEQTGQYVEFTVMKSADALVIRYGMPDHPRGEGIESTLSLYVNGKPCGKLALTSRYAWVYGDFPWQKDPAAGKPHRFFDESQAAIPPVGIGDTVRVQKDADDMAAYYLIDRIDLEQRPPPQPAPADALSITDYGAVPDSLSDSSKALNACLAAARHEGRTVWIPPGHFRLEGSPIPLGGITIRGAGPWYSRLTGNGAMFRGVGERVTVSDLAIFGEVNQRHDSSSDNAFTGDFGDGTVLNNLWIEHMKCGIWTTHGTRRMRVTRCRIRNTMADGVNFCDGTRDSVVEYCHLRNTGDDALATWSPSAAWSSGTPCKRNAFLHNVIESPWLANGIGIYGGRDHRAIGNIVRDTVYSGAGILVSSGHGAVPFSGRITLEGNTVIRVGGDAYIGDTVGGLWLFAQESDITAPIIVRGLRLQDSLNSGVSLHGPGALRDVRLDDVSIEGAGDHGIHIKPGARGSVRLRHVRMTGVGAVSIRNDGGSAFAVRGLIPCAARTAAEPTVPVTEQPETGNSL